MPTLLRVLKPIDLNRYQQQQIDPALIAALDSMQLHGNDWHMDTAASSHMASDPGNFHTLIPCSSQSVTVGNGAMLPVTHTSSQTIPSLSKPLYLHNILLVPHIMKNLISVRQFYLDNYCTIEFDRFGFSVKALPSRIMILRCNSQGPLYIVTPTTSTALLATTSSDLWHRRLGHPGHQSMPPLHSSTVRSTNKTGSSLCHACQLGKHVRLPFSLSQYFTSRPFELLHCDLWTSPIPSTSGFAII
jgi:hypothetical protein